MDAHTDVLMESVVSNREDLKERLAYLHNGKDINPPGVVKKPNICSMSLIVFSVPFPFDC